MTNNAKFIPLLVFAGIIDGVDYIGGALPVVGDIIDIAGVAVFAISGMGFISALGLVELIPSADFLPIHIATVLLAWKLGRFKD